MAQNGQKSRFFWDDQSQLPRPVSLSSLNHFRPLWCRFVAYPIGFPTTPQWPGLVENASRNLRYLYGTFFPKWTKNRPKMAQNGQKSRFFWNDQFQLPHPVSRSTLNHSRPLWCRFVAYLVGFPTTPQWPGLVENASHNLSRLCHRFFPKWTKNRPKMAQNGQKSRFFWNDQFQLPHPVSRSTLNHSRPLWCRFVAYLVGFPTTPQWPGLVENAQRKVPNIGMIFGPKMA